MCRSKRIASRIVHDTAVVRALVSLHQVGDAVVESALLKKLLDRLRCFDTYRALDKAYPASEGDENVPSLDEEQLQKQVEEIALRSVEKKEAVETE